MKKQLTVKKMKQHKFWSILPVIFAIGLMQSPQNTIVEKVNETNHVENYQFDVLTTNSWKMVGLTVYPAITTQGDLLITDVFPQLAEASKQDVISFQQDGGYAILQMPEMALGNSNLQADMNEMVSPQQVAETGTWSLSDSAIKMNTDNGRMESNQSKIINIDNHQLIMTFTKIIDGEVHTFTQTFEAQQAVHFGW